MKIECTISTPQHKDGKVHHFHTQRGEFDTETLLFEPRRFDFGLGSLFGDHKVQFKSLEAFESVLVNPNEDLIKSLLDFLYK